MVLRSLTWTLSGISILSLHKDRYDLFTEPQAPNVKLRPEQLGLKALRITYSSLRQWEELQELMLWIVSRSKIASLVAILVD